ncbi:unnamed protein product [Thlaspi arvense]|uniref:C-terminal processing peptidase n=1 Tax=Thlaspi arvense TaxID=13288 RepID=A0AAU9RN12_THLAR|nr:unnamed protein product [Thlaspi arvense]
MRLLLPFSATSPPASPPSFPEHPHPSQIEYSGLIKIFKKSVIGTLTGALSLTLVFSSPVFSVAAAIDPYLSLNPPSLSPDSSLNYFDSSPEDCPNEEEEADTETRDDDVRPQVVTNEGIVEEAWEIVNDSFLDTRSHSWTPETWQKQKEDILASPIKSRSKAHEVIKKMLASLGDQYTRFLSPDEFSRMSKYDITGIGINLREVSDGGGNVKLKVLGLVMDGPADIAGVKQGDEILAVNGVDVSGKSSFEVSSLLQGPSKTYVVLKVKHGKCGPLKSIKVQRQVNATTPVSYRLEKVDNGKISVGYIRLKEFNALARKDLVIAMKRLQDKGASYFVMDLRDNLGGLVQAGIETAKLFLDEGDTVIYTAGRDTESQKTVLADRKPLTTAPLIVMVNNRTASASEIVASALHDNCKAVLVGERTYGKGLIQSVFELRDGSGVVVTIGKYVTPNHIDINGGGIEPDFRNLPVVCPSMVSTEVCTAVSGMKPMSPPPESDGSADFLDNNRLQETFSNGGLDFDDWTLLISEIETSFPDDIEKLCLVYDAFLLEFPLCHGYWKKYAYHKIKLCTLEDAVEVFERAVQAATYSVSLWLDYCAFGVAAYEDPHDVSSFRKISSSLKEKIKCRIDANGDLFSDPMEEDLVPTRHTDEEISVVIRDLMGPSSSSAVSKALHEYLSIGEQFYQDSQQLEDKISCFETHIRRPYFHVNPLDTNQLDNWHAYLSFAETYGDFDWAIKLYERCLIPCANYTEFWFRYVDFVESNGGRELANFALARASQTFVKDASVIHLFNARFKEHVGDASAASDALSLCGEELGLGFVENVTKKANMEKRLGNFEAAVTTYREALKKALIEKENLESTALLYVQFSRLKYMITNSADEAAQILIEGNEKVPHCKLLLEELIRLLMMHGGTRQVDLVDPIIDKEISHQADFSDGLSAKDKEEISNLYMEFIDLSGTIHDVRKALRRHIKLFPHSARAKSHGLCPLRKSFRELIQRREKTRVSTTQELSIDNSIGDTVVLPPEEKKDLPLDSDGSQSKGANRSDYLNNEPNLESLSSGFQIEGNSNVADRENLCESQSDLSLGLKADESGERSREVSLPIQAAPRHCFVTKQARFSSSSVDTVASDAIEIQPNRQEFLRQTSRNRYHRNDSNLSSHERPFHVSNSPASASQTPQYQCQNSASQLHPMVQTSIAHPQAQISGQQMSVATSENPATLQSSISQNPQKQYQDYASQVQTSFAAYPQTQSPQNPMQSNGQEAQMQSNEAYNQMWQQYYYCNYYYQQQQQQLLMSQQPQQQQLIVENLEEMK